MGQSEDDPTPPGSSGTAISVVIPAFKSSETLAELVSRLRTVLEQAAPAFEIVIVNDGSNDATWSTIVDLAHQVPEVRGIDFMRNYGQHNAVLCGIRSSRHPITITIDDDLQHPPEEIPKLLARLEEGFDVVYGTPEVEQHGLLRNLASRFTKLALRTSIGVKTAQQVSAFRAFRTELRDAFDRYRAPFVSIDVLLTWASKRFGSVTVDHRERAIGESNYTVGRLVAHALNMITGFSTLPLQLASWVGFGFTVFGMLVLAYVLVRYVMAGGSVPGFPFLASIIVIFSGAQLFALGIIGEYLARMHFRLMDRPPYVVRSVAGTEEGDGTHQP